MRRAGASNSWSPRKRLPIRLGVAAHHINHQARPSVHHHQEERQDPVVLVAGLSWSAAAGDGVQSPRRNRLEDPALSAGNAARRIVIGSQDPTQELPAPHLGVARPLRAGHGVESWSDTPRVLQVHAGGHKLGRSHARKRGRVAAAIADQHAAQAEDQNDRYAGSPERGAPRRMKCRPSNAHRRPQFSCCAPVGRGTGGVRRVLAPTAA